MKYRSISLNENGKDKYSLVKYNDNYKSCLEELRKMNSDLADSVENCPKLYSELSEHQSYMLFRGLYECVGAINIETSTDEKNLEVEIQLNEKYFDSSLEMRNVIEQIVESLKLYFFDKENIEVRLNNDIDLSKINRDKYQKKVYDDTLTTYACSNERNNILFSNLINEMNESEKRLTDWGQYWRQELQTATDSKDIQYVFDEELLEEINNGTVTLSELFYKVEKVLWPDINSENSSRTISFSRNGRVDFIRASHKGDRIDYVFKYNVLSNDFYLRTGNLFRKTVLEIDNNNQFTSIQSHPLNILYSKENNLKKITYITPIVDDSSVAVELWANGEDEIERCYIDFRTHIRTHKRKSKINGLYRLTLDTTRGIFSLKFISRKGNKSSNFLQVLTQEDQELYSTILSEKVTMENVDELIKKVIPIINRRVTKSINHGENRKYIANFNNTVMSDLENAERDAFNFVKQIKGEIPLPHLEAILEHFLEENDKVKKADDKRLLKNKIY